MIISPPAEGSSGPSSYRLKRGTKLSDIPTTTPPLSSLDGPFQLAEYLSLRVRADPHDVKSLVDVPSSDGSVGGKAPERDVWIYEHLRRIPIDINPLLTQLLGICTRETCPTMKADEWLYLCVAHGSGGTEECCAIDYILHTLDTTTALLNSSKSFPSRLSIPTASLSHFPSLFRRLSRIFSHAYYHHREAFSLAEADTSLYARFVGLCEKYELVGPGLLVIPRDVVGGFGSGEQEEDEEESEEDEDEEEDEEEEAEAEGQPERGREVKGEEKRTQSLDRGLRPSAAASPDTSHRTKSIPAVPDTAASEDPFRNPPSNESESATIVTSGRGKQPRGTMLWSSDTSGSDTPVAEIPQPVFQDGTELSRMESFESVIHVGPDTREEESVPKDEIELLEEEGKIPPLPSVAPLPPPESERKDEDGMEDVHLGDSADGREEERSQVEQAENDTGSVVAGSSVEAERLDEPASLEDQGEGGRTAEGEAEEVVSPDEAREVDKANEEAKEAI